MKTLGTGAAKLNILFQIGSTRTINFDFGIDISGWTFEFFVKQNKGARLKDISLTLNSGITIPVYNSTQIDVSFSAVNTTLVEGEYYWELRRTDLNVPLLNGLAFFSYDAQEGTMSVPLEITIGEQTIDVSISSVIAVNQASQTEVDSETSISKYVNPATLAGKALKNGTYSTTLNFNTDQDIYKDATGLSITFTLGNNNINGKGIFLRLNKPTAVTFPSNFVADSSSATLDATKLNVYLLIFFTNWDGSGTDKIVYKNSLYTAL